MSAKQIAEAWEFASSSGAGIYETVRNTDGSTSCNCPGWTRRVDAQGNRSCKHTRMVDMGTAQQHCQGHVTYQQQQVIATVSVTVTQPVIRRANFGHVKRKLAR